MLKTQNADKKKIYYQKTYTKLMNWKTQHSSDESPLIYV